MRRSVWLFACGALAIIGLFAPEVASLPVKLFADEQAIRGVRSGTVGRCSTPTSYPPDAGPLYLLTRLQCRPLSLP
jgi:hypothetical protein